MSKDNSVKERPILFSGEMVKAILEGRKTQTRRVVKPQPKWKFSGNYIREPVASHVYGLWWVTVGFGLACGTKKLGNSHYGKPGDRLWVRETWAADSSRLIYSYRADEQNSITRYTKKDYGGTGWKPSIHMPRWASRIMLEIVNVRVERVQDISEEDAKAEGAGYMVPLAKSNPNWIGGFQYGWDSIYSKSNPWESNPWVWVIEFKVVENG